MPYVTPERSAPPPRFTGVGGDGDVFRPEEWRIVVGGTGLSCLGCVALWLRLIGTEGWLDATATVLAGVSWGEVETAVPRSRHSRTFVGEGDVPSAFAWSGGRLFLGAPTEEAWDRFAEAVQRP